MQWLVGAVVTDDVKRGGGAIAPLPEGYFFEKKTTSCYQIATGFLPKIFSRHWLANKRKKMLERSSPLNTHAMKLNFHLIKYKYS